jgi:hypothetical protein
MARIRPFQSPNRNKTIATLAGSSNVLASVIASVWRENICQEASKGLSYWNSLFANVLAHSQESTDGFHMPGRTFFGQIQPSEVSTQLRDNNNRRRYATIALVLSTELDGGVRESIFRLPNTTRKEWIYKQERAFPLPFYATFGLMAEPPLGRRCAKCGREHGPGNRCTLRQMEYPNGFGPCHYAFCTTKGTHALKVCMVLNNKCTRCLYRGHQRNDRCTSQATGTGIGEPGTDSTPLSG